MPADTPQTSSNSEASPGDMFTAVVRAVHTRTADRYTAAHQAFTALPWQEQTRALLLHACFLPTQLIALYTPELGEIGANNAVVHELTDAVSWVAGIDRTFGDAIEHADGGFLEQALAPLTTDTPTIAGIGIAGAYAAVSAAVLIQHLVDGNVAENRIATLLDNLFNKAGDTAADTISVLREEIRAGTLRLNLGDGTVGGWTLRRDERFAHMIEKGILNAGDVLHAADDPTVVAVVTDNYGLSVGGLRQESPDVAAAAVGHDGDGWKFWTVDKGNGPQPLEVFG